MLNQAGKMQLVTEQISIAAELVSGVWTFGWAIDCPL
jgi:hypothetical protein